MNNIDTITRLAGLDPQGGLDPTDEVSQRQAELFAAIVSEPLRTRLSRSHFRRRLLIAGASIACGILVAVGLIVIGPQLTTPMATDGPGTLSAADLASWTNVPAPTAVNSRVVTACSSHLGHEPISSGRPQIRLADLRGQVTSAIVSAGDYVGYCVVGSDPDPVFALLAEPGAASPTSHPGSITLGVAGGHSAPNGYVFAEGTAGGEVKSVTIHQDGLTIDASVGGGYWVAWWPIKGADDSDPIVTGPFTVVTHSGTTRSYSASDLRPRGSN